MTEHKANEPSTADLQEPSTEKDPAEVPAAQKPAAAEPSHEAIGIGVIQDEPVMDMHVASDDDKIRGIVDQTRQDVGGEGEERIIEVLRQRFEESGLAVDEAQLPRLAGEVASA